MKQLALHDRPREKLAQLGAAGLGDNELIAIVLGHGSKSHTALAIANEVLAAGDGLVGLTRLGYGALRRLPGLGPARAAQLLAAVEIGRRTLVTRAPTRQQFASPRELAAFLLPQFGAREVEQSGVVLLDPRRRLIRTVLLSVGTADASLVHPRDVFREGLVLGAVALVLFHNHPSGDPTPSHEDVVLTRRMHAAGEVMGIELLDHIILADARYFSFREVGALAGEPRGRGCPSETG